LDEAEAALKAAGIAVEAHKRPGLEHSIDQDGLNLAAAFLQARVGQPPKR
jgi:phospholipase/carboxylesterase